MRGHTYGRETMRQPGSPEAALLMAVLVQATNDARRGDSKARDWLQASPWCETICDWLDLSMTFRARLRCLPVDGKRGNLQLVVKRAA